MTSYLYNFYLVEVLEGLGESPARWAEGGCEEEADELLAVDLIVGRLEL